MLGTLEHSPVTEHDRSWAPARGLPAELDAAPLLLRRWRLDDLVPLEREIESSREHLAEWLTWARTADHASLFAFLLASEAGFDAGTDFGYGLRDPAGALVGGASLHARRGRGALEIGYWVAAGHAGRGYATSAARALTAAGLALPDVHRIEIHCDEANLRSAAIPRKLGYRLDRIVEESTGRAPATNRLMVWVLER
jgi:RimJ/RimL family protein N-acetyltransferase